MRFEGKEYELVKVYKDEVSELKDMLLFKCEYGYYECFQRFDLKKYEEEIKRKIWEDKDAEQIREYIRQGLKPKEISSRMLIKDKPKKDIYHKAVYEYKKYKRGVWK